jgi:hypothetical protein
VAAAQPAPSPDEESESWDSLAPATDEVAARADTPPRQTRKSTPPATRRPGGSRPGVRAIAPDDRRRVLIVVAVVAAVILGGFGAATLWALSRDKAPPPATDTGPPPRAALRVGVGQKYATVSQALRSTIPGDHIIVYGPEIEDEFVLDGQGERRKNLTIEAEDAGQPVLWRLPKGGKTTPSHLILLSGVEGLRLRGFTFDGDNRCTKSVVLLTGRCPGTTLEDVTVRGFATTGVLLMNCEGEEGRPVTLNRLTVTTPPNKTPEAAIGFDLAPQTPRPNRFIHFNDPRLEGPYKARVLHPEKAGDGVTGLPK